MSDNVNNPEHYTYGKIKCIDLIEQVTEGMGGKQAFCIGNALKYIFRHTHKNGSEDIEKAIWYLNEYLGKHNE